MSLFSLINRLFCRKKYKHNTSSPKKEADTFSHNNQPKKFTKLKKTDNNYFFTQRKNFSKSGTLKESTIKTVFNFAYDMTFGAEGQHRDHRSGGSHQRKAGEIFANTFQGKLAECAACNYFYKVDENVKPDFSLYKLGKWDSTDLNAQGKDIAIKSTKHYGQLLLLEENDWDENGEYIPNKDGGTSKYDCIVMIRLKPSCEDLMKQNRLLFSSKTDRKTLEKLILEQNWEYEFSGFITRADLTKIIDDKMILPKDSFLNATTKIDADNYYVQIAELRDMKTYKEIIGEL